TAYSGHENRSVEASARSIPLRRRAWRGAARRGEEPRQGAHLLAAQRRAWLEPEEPAPGALAALQHAARRAGIDARLSAVELDQARRLGIHRSRRDRRRAPLFRRA